jgi:hypothetical protein
MPTVRFAWTPHRQSRFKKRFLSSPFKGKEGRYKLVRFAFSRALPPRYRGIDILFASVKHNTQSKWCNNILMLVILTNAVMVAFESTSVAYQIVDVAFFAIYTLEMVVKLYVKRREYFDSGYNILDFSLVAVSLIELVAEDHFPFLNISYVRVIRSAFSREK